MNTPAKATEWASLELIKHPKIRKKLQEEPETVVGMDRMVEESDLEKLEVFRHGCKGNSEASSSGAIVDSSCVIVGLTQKGIWEVI